MGPLGERTPTVRLAAVGSLMVGLLFADGCQSVATTSAHDANAGAQSVEDLELLPTGVRRLTNREFRKFAGALLGIDVARDVEDRLPPDVRQEDGYTRNVAQTVSSALAVALEQVVPPLVESALTRPEQVLFRCADLDAACVHQWVHAKATQAYRRALDPSEVRRLEALYEEGRKTGDATEGAAWVLVALLSSPDLWYVRELGPSGSAVVPSAVAHSVVELSQYEIADQIGFVVRGTPADGPLLAAAEAGKLGDASERIAQGRRLLGLLDSREHYREFVLAWLEVDRLEQTAKSERVFERYDAFKSRMLSETQNFVDEVFVSEGASVSRLLNAGFVSVDPEMAVFYGLREYGARVDARSVGRYGVLQQASFLASHAHSDTTSPVLRGDFVLRKLLCERLPRPSELDIEVIMPRPSSEMTRREQFARHGADPQCAQCHEQIDGFGLVFEEFDAVGRRRDLELGRSVRTDGTVKYADAQHPFANSKELVDWLVQRPETAECFARQAFRFVTGRHAPDAEAAFLRLRDDLDEPSRSNILEHLLAYVGSPSFVKRRAL